MQDKYSIIIPHYNDITLMEKLFESLKKQNLENIQVLIIDDYSKEENYEKLRSLAKEHKNIKVIRSEKNAGPANARNIGIKHSNAEYLIFTDSDCIVSNNWIKTIEEFYKDKVNENKVLQGRVKIMKSSIIGQCVSALGFPAGGTIGFEKIWPVNSKNETKQLVTCNCVIPKKIIEEVGLFDTSFPVQFGEDTDLGLRIVEKGFKIIFFPKLFVYHPVRDNFKSFIKWTWIRGRGAYYFKKKHSKKGFIKTRLWSSKNILLNGLKTIKFPLIAFFLFLYLLIFYLGFLSEKRKVK